MLLECFHALEFGGIGRIIEKDSELQLMSDEEKFSADDADGNCKQCGHPFNPHIVVAYDMEDFSRGGEIRCPVVGCNCFHSLDFNFKTSP